MRAGRQTDAVKITKCVIDDRNAIDHRQRSLGTDLYAAGGTTALLLIDNDLHRGHILPAIDVGLFRSIRGL